MDTRPLSTRGVTAPDWLIAANKPRPVDGGRGQRRRRLTALRDANVPNWHQLIHRRRDWSRDYRWVGENLWQRFIQKWAGFPAERFYCAAALWILPWQSSAGYPLLGRTSLSTNGTNSDSSKGISEVRGQTGSRRSNDHCSLLRKKNDHLKVFGSCQNLVWPPQGLGSILLEKLWWSFLSLSGFLSSNQALQLWIDCVMVPCKTWGHFWVSDDE